MRNWFEKLLFPRRAETNTPLGGKVQYYGNNILIPNEQNNITKQAEEEGVLPGNLGFQEVFDKDQANTILPTLAIPGKEGQILRGLASFRSSQVFSHTLPGGTEVYRVMKGGDELIAGAQDWETFVSRIQMNEIVCGDTVKDAEKEYKAMEKINQWSVVQEGHLAYIPFPLRVFGIEGVVVDGSNIPNKDYYNKYASPNALGHRQANEALKANFGSNELGDIYESRDLDPAILESLIPGPDIRVDQLISSMMFRGTGLEDLMKGDEFVDFEDRYTSATQLTFAGDEIMKRTGATMDQVLRGAARELVLAGGVEWADKVDEILPEGGVTKESYLGWLLEFSRNMEKSGFADDFLEQFDDRRAYVAALVHSKRHTLSNDPQYGSSTQSRNATLTGYTVDLDTLTPMDNYENYKELGENVLAERVNADLEGLLQTSIAMQWLFPRNVYDYTKVKDRYEYWLQRFTPEDKELNDYFLQMMDMNEKICEGMADKRMRIA